MSLVERDPVDYSCITDDELMLKELERRDGIYSFIFHELEKPKDLNTTPDNCKLKNQVYLIDNGRSEEIITSSRSLDTKLKQTITNEPPKVDLTPTLNEPCFPSQFLASLNHQTLTNFSTAFKSSGFKYSPIFKSAYNGNTLSTFSSSCRFMSHSKFYDFISSSNAIRVRIPTPRFSNVYAPMVRNRRHPLKETLEYKNFYNQIEYAPDLRDLFPFDPDVYAPFVKIVPYSCDDVDVEIIDS